ncbi:MAG: hypothetical protein CSB44_00550 [Gammaproteobacteria bacterium]|nr:MAG: hypothetical protein CSB44_00550 [Gammaproteobacteria bacterium]
MKAIRLLNTALVLATALTLGACAGNKSRDVEIPGNAPVLPTQPANIVDMLTESGQFSSLLAALDAAELTDDVRSGRFTLFAPSDAAFEALPAGVMDAYMQPRNKQQLQTVLRYHLIGGNLDAKKLGSMTTATTVMGKQISLSSDGIDLFVEGIRANPVDVRATNGMIHVIDNVLIPQ